MARWNFKGWDFKKWALTNKGNLRSLLALLVGYSYFAGFDWKTFLGALAVIVGKLVLDSFDYWLSE